MILFDLLISFIKIGLFSFGGGYAAIPLIQQEVVQNHHWMSQNTYIDILTISEMTPGPLGVNSATFVGMQLEGLSGAIVATLGFILPSFVIVSILGHLYLKYNSANIVKAVLKGIRPVIIAIIFSAGLGILYPALYSEGNINYLQIAICLLTIILCLKFKYSPVKIIVIVALINLSITLISVYI
ncbi:chromate transporter [Bacilli bacterium PM5-9]|nr:chromate transporter [Bacilli bacterium PM5-9]